MPAEDCLQSADLEFLRRRALVRHIDWHESLPSTNDRALELAAIPEVEMPCLIAAGRQTAGRGRGANRWWSAPGALTWSLLIQWPANRPRGVPIPISLLAGIAVCEALEQLAQVPAALKWPNDVYVSGRKICGILVEVPPRVAGRLVVGIGLNVNNQFRAAPDQLQQTAVALSEVAGRSFALGTVLGEVLERFLRELDPHPHGSQQLVRRWRDRCLLTGRTVEVSAGNQTTRGECLGIDATGALVLRTSSGDRPCHSGIVSRIE